MTNLTTNPNPHRKLAPFFDQLCWHLLDQLSCWCPPDTISEDLTDANPRPPLDPIELQRENAYRTGAFEQLESLTRFIRDNQIDAVACAQRHADRNNLDMPELDHAYVAVLQDTTVDLDE